MSGQNMIGHVNETIPGEGLDGFGEPEPSIRSKSRELDHRLIHQPFDADINVIRRERLKGANLPCGFQVEAGNEDSQSSEQPPIRLVEQLKAPINCCFEGLVAGKSSSPASLEK
jgi:hypothetical protein